MTQRRAFGTTCSGCGKTMKLGEIELKENARTEDLINALVEQDWGSRIVECWRCGYGRQYGLADVHLLD